jgi:hypothetical protein
MRRVPLVGSPVCPGVIRALTGPSPSPEACLIGLRREKYRASSGSTQRIVAPLARDTTIRLTPAERD